MNMVNNHSWILTSNVGRCPQRTKILIQSTLTQLESVRRTNQSSGKKEKKKTLCNKMWMRRYRPYSKLDASLMLCQSHTDRHTICPPGLIYNRVDRAHKLGEQRHQDTSAFSASKHGHVSRLPEDMGITCWQWKIFTSHQLIVHHPIHYAAILQVINICKEGSMSICG